jgi:hypothetical protein
MVTLAIDLTVISLTETREGGASGCFCFFKDRQNAPYYYRKIVVGNG